MLFVIIGIVAAVCIACAIAIPVIVSKNMAKEKIAQISDKIVKVTSAAYSGDDELLAVYEEYDSLTNSQKQKVENGQLIVDAYNSIQEKVDNVDALISKTDYSNWFAETNTTKTAVQVYNKRLGSVWINALSSICDVPEVRAELDALQIPPSHSVIATLALGFPDEKPRLLAKKNDVVRWAD